MLGDIYEISEDKHIIYHILSTEFSYKKQRPIDERLSLLCHRCQPPGSNVLASSSCSLHFGDFSLSLTDLLTVPVVALTKKHHITSGLH